MIKKCPHCKSTKGVTKNYTIHRYGWENVDFKGNLLDCYRTTSDDFDSTAVCLDCGGFIDTFKINDST